MITASGKSVLACLVLAFGLTGSVYATAPKITASTDVDFYFNPQSPGDDQFGFRIATTGDTPTFEAIGLPPDAVLNPATGWITGNRSAPGRYDIAVRATNRDGTDSTVLHLAIHPATIGVRSSEGVFHPGQAFSITLHYNADMTVTGAPSLALVIGRAGAPVFKNAVYVSGSGTNELTFQYSVTAKDYDPDGVQLLPRAPSGGTICDANGLTATPSLPLRYFVSRITITPDPSVIAATRAKHSESEPLIFANLR